MSSFSGKPSKAFFGFFVAFFGLTVLLLLLTDLFRRVFAGDHVGWNRLTMVAALVAASATAGWRVHGGNPAYGRVYTALGLTAVVIGYALAALVIVAFSFVYGRMVVVWVMAGFRQEAKQKPSHD